MKADTRFFFDAFLLGCVEYLLDLLHSLAVKCGGDDALLSVRSDCQSCDHRYRVGMLKGADDVFANLFLGVAYRRNELCELCLICLVCWLDATHRVCSRAFRSLMGVRCFSLRVWLTVW